MKQAIIGLTLFWVALSTLSAASRRPLLFPNPENPGAHPLQDVRALMLQRFDADQDGYLNPEEREQMRLTTKSEANQRSDKVRQARRQRRQREEEENRPPERWLQLYDKNKNKRFDNGEWEVARSMEIKRVTAKFDSNKDDKLDDQEKKSVISDLKNNRFNGYDQYIRRIVAGIEGREGERSRSKGRSRWRDFDFNQDGKASQDELEAIRQHEAKQQKESNNDR